MDKEKLRECLKLTEEVINEWFRKQCITVGCEETISGMFSNSLKIEGFEISWLIDTGEERFYLEFPDDVIKGYRIWVSLECFGKAEKCEVGTKFTRSTSGVVMDLCYFGTFEAKDLEISLDCEQSLPNSERKEENIDEKVEKLANLLSQIPSCTNTFRVTLVSDVFESFWGKGYNNVECICGMLIRKYEGCSNYVLKGKHEYDTFVEIAKCLLDISKSIDKSKFLDARDNLSDMLTYKLYQKTFQDVNC